MDKKHRAHLSAYSLEHEEAGGVDTRGRLLSLCQGRVESVRSGQPAEGLSEREGLEEGGPPTPTPPHALGGMRAAEYTVRPQMSRSS